MQDLATIVEAGPDPATDGVVRWRRIDLCAVVERRFGVRLAERTMGAILRRLGFTRLSARPRHPQSDAEAQSQYKKLRRNGACGIVRDGAGQAAGGLVSYRRPEQLTGRRFFPPGCLRPGMRPPAPWRAH
mgnify:CR=1 FL=1